MRSVRPWSRARPRRSPRTSAPRSRSGGRWSDRPGSSRNKSREPRQDTRGVLPKTEGLGGAGMTAIKANDNDELEAELAKIVLERVETQRREAGEHVIRQVAFRYSMQPLIGAIERLQGLGLRDQRQQLIRLQYLKPVEGVRIEFGRFVATIVAHRDGSTCRVEMMRNEGTMI